MEDDHEGEAYSMAERMNCLYRSVSVSLSCPQVEADKAFSELMRGEVLWMMEAMW